MTARDFCFWLQGFMEISNSEYGLDSISSSQITCIQNHLNLVFKHNIDPQINSTHSKEEVEELDKIHTNTGPVMRC